MVAERSNLAVGNPLPVASAQSVSSGAPAKVATNRVVNASNVIVKKQKLFLTNDESAAARVERIEIEIVLQQSQISVRRKGVDRGEAEASNDVFTLLEHPSVTVYGSYTVLRPRYTVYGDIHGIPYPDTDVCRLLAHTYIC